jgi:hypothetical protein
MVAIALPSDRVQVDAAKTILMAQMRVDQAMFRNRQSDEIHQILEAVLRRKAELAALDRDDDE